MNKLRLPAFIAATALTMGALVATASGAHAVSPASQAPAAPTGVKIVQKTEDSVDLSWNAVRDAEYYVVRLFDEYGTELDVIEEDAPSFSFDDFEEGEIYGIRVAAAVELNSEDEDEEAIDDVALSALSPLLTFQAPLETPDLYVDDDESTPTSIYAEWDEVYGANFYMLAVAPAKGGEASLHKIDASEEDFTFKGLTPDTTYKVTLMAMDNDGYSYASDAEKVSTTPNKPVTPSNVQVKSGTKYAVVSWGSVAGATKYSVTVSRAKSKSITKTTKKNSLRIAKLASGADYRVRVVAINAGGDSKPSNPVKFSTKISTAVSVSRKVLPGKKFDAYTVTVSFAKTGKSKKARLNVSVAGKKKSLVKTAKIKKSGGQYVATFSFRLPAKAKANIAFSTPYLAKNGKISR